MIETRVAASYVRLLYEYLTAQGRDPVAVLGALPGAQAHFVAMRDWQAMLAKVQALDPAPALGLRVARGIGARHFGVLGYAALACANLAQALHRLERHHQAVYDVNPPQVRRAPDGLCIEWGIERGRPGALVDETAIASLVQLARDMTGHPITVLGVHFVNPAPAELAPYEAFFGGPVRFNQPSTRVTLRTADLALPMRKSDPALLALLDQQAERLLQDVAALPEGLARWRTSLVSLIREGQTSLTALARAHHMSPRSLQRRLAEQGGSFQGLLDDTRRQLASAYLQDPSLELAEIALLLGYSEQSAFTRAFRHWTGQAPAQWRKQNGRGSL